MSAQATKHPADSLTIVVNVVFILLTMYAENAEAVRQFLVAIAGDQWGGYVAAFLGAINLYLRKRTTKGLSLDAPSKAAAALRRILK